MVLTVNFSCITDQVSNDQRGTKQVTKSRYGIVAYWCETLPVGFDIKHGLYWHDSIVRRGPPGLPRRKCMERGRDRSSRRLRAFRILLIRTAKYGRRLHTGGSRRRFSASVSESGLAMINFVAAVITLIASVFDFNLQTTALVSAISGIGILP
jgi:hypothetical protein